MKLNEAVDFMSKTQNNMYSTMAPVTTPRRRYFEAGQSISLKKSTLDRTSDIVPVHLAATFTKDFRKEVKTPVLP